MLTPTTRAAIAVLKDIYACTTGSCTEMHELTPQALEEVTDKLRSAGLICQEDNAATPPAPPYHSTRKVEEISLIDILEATGEHLNCNRPTTEEFYMHHGRAAPKLGVVNHITRFYLKEIKLFDL